MKAIILDAGKARRLYPLSKNKPTCLFEVSGRTILEHHVAMLRHLGIKQIYVVIGHCADRVRNIRQGLHFIYNPHFAVTGGLVSLWYACRKIKGDFLYFYGDGIYSKELIEGLIKANGDIVMAIEKGSHHTTYERLKICNNKIFQVRFTTELSEGDGSYVGITKVSNNAGRSFTSMLNRIVDEGHLENHCTYIIQRLIEEGQEVQYLSCTNQTWHHFDNADDFEEVERIEKILQH